MKRASLLGARGQLGGRERDGNGTDTALLPVPLSGVRSHEWQGNTVNGFPVLSLRTADATVTLVQVERIGFADLALTVRHDPLADFLFYARAYADVAAADADAGGLKSTVDEVNPDTEWSAFAPVGSKKDKKKGKKGAAEAAAAAEPLQFWAIARRARASSLRRKNIVKRPATRR